MKNIPQPLNTTSNGAKNISPRHIAFIMDGNGRWALNKKRSRSFGHKEGLKTIKVITTAAFDAGAELVSFFALSTENFLRPKREVDALMRLLKGNLPTLAKELADKGISVIFSGDTSAFSEELRKIILECGNKYSGQKAVNICLNYGGKSEIVRAANLLVNEGKMTDEEGFKNYLYNNLPDPDLLIRTGGEKRLSNFLLYQCAYTELYFTDVLWPDFSVNDLDLALKDFSLRNRRFGRVNQ